MTQEERDFLIWRNQFKANYQKGIDFLRQILNSEIQAERFASSYAAISVIFGASVDEPDGNSDELLEILSESPYMDLAVRTWLQRELAADSLSVWLKESQNREALMADAHKMYVVRYSDTVEGELLSLLCGLSEQVRAKEFAQNSARRQTLFDHSEAMNEAAQSVVFLTALFTDAQALEAARNSKSASAAMQKTNADAAIQTARRVGALRDVRLFHVSDLLDQNAPYQQAATMQVLTYCPGVLAEMKAQHKVYKTALDNFMKGLNTTGVSLDAFSFYQVLQNEGSRFAFCRSTDCPYFLDDADVLHILHTLCDGITDSYADLNELYADETARKTVYADWTMSALFFANERQRTRMNNSDTTAAKYAANYEMAIGPIVAYWVGMAASYTGFFAALSASATGRTAYNKYVNWNCSHTAPTPDFTKVDASSSPFLDEEKFLYFNKKYPTGTNSVQTPDTIWMRFTVNVGSHGVVDVRDLDADNSLYDRLKEMDTSYMCCMGGFKAKGNGIANYSAYQK